MGSRHRYSTQAPRGAAGGGNRVSGIAEDTQPVAFRSRVLGNRLLASLPADDRSTLERAGEVVRLDRGMVLCDIGQDVHSTFFPGAGTVASFVLLLRDGRTVEAATIGCEGAIGGIVSSGHKPAFARAEVQIGGAALRVPIERLEELKSTSFALRDVFTRYADFLLAQVMQSVACNAFHALEARCCRWLLTTRDRVGADDIRLTQESLAEMLGVQRTTVSSIARSLQSQGLISYSRGLIRMLDRDGVRAVACECYENVEAHFAAVLPELVRPARIVDLKR